MTLSIILSHYNRITPQSYDNFNIFRSSILSKPLLFYHNESMIIYDIIDEEYRKLQTLHIIEKYKLSDNIELEQFLLDKLFNYICSVLNYDDDPVQTGTKIDFLFLLNVNIIKKLADVGYRYLCGRKYKKTIIIPEESQILESSGEMVLFAYLLHYEIDIIIYDK